MAVSSDLADIMEDEINCQPTEEQLSELQVLSDLVECPNCQSCFALQEYAKSQTTPISCPLCQRTGLKNCAELLRHLRVVHVKTGIRRGSSRELGGKRNPSLGKTAGSKRERWSKIYKTIHDRKKLPKEGDRVLAMWSESKWEYFGATVSRFDADSMTYVVKWIHEEVDESNISVEHIALDEILDDNEIGAGTLVLFRQGAYTSSQKQKERNRGARRWHKGIITSVNKAEDGSKTYSGHHTKTDVDGKFIQYQRYSYNFTNLTKFDFRLAPNIFDVLLFSSQAEEDTLEEGDPPAMDTDIYLSYDVIDSARDIEANNIEASTIPDSYKKFGYEKMCDPADIEDFLKSQGLSVCKQVHSSEGKHGIKKVASMIKHSTVFIACLSDQYVSNTQCCMEFQHAKVSLKKPVIPLVVGDGSFKWMTSLMGMLIAGELFIHFRDKEVESDKNLELLMNIRNHIPEPEIVVEKEEELFASVEKMPWDDEVDHPGDEKKKTLTLKKTKAPPEIFLSYCWSNSHLAHEAKQIESLRGTALSDPRLLKEKLEEAGYEVWVDIERLESANADAGLFGQIVQGIKSSLLVVPCVSDEYANSQNCTMEFQFSVKSLSKPVVPVVVGSGEDWKHSVIGCLLSNNDKEPINIQEISDMSELDEKLSQIIWEIEAIIGKPRKEIMRKAARAKSVDLAFKSLFSSSSSSSDSSSDSDGEEKESIEANDYERIKPSSAVFPLPRLRAPKIEDRVIGHYSNLLYSAGIVVGVNVRTLTYTVDWDSDELEQLSVIPYDQVALDEPIERDDIGVGMEILFPQGNYFCNTCDENHLRYFEGEITSIMEGEDDGDGNASPTLVSGNRLKPSFMGYLLNSAAYDHYFENVPLEDIRLPPTAFDFMEMCVNEEDGKTEKKNRVKFYSRSLSLD